jgi:hypothetical protein
MSRMFKRMTIWAQNLKIFWCIVVSIAVFMVNAKNFRLYTVSAPLTVGNQISSRHSFAYSCILRSPHQLMRSIHARFRTVFSFVRWRIQKICAAMLTRILFCASVYLRFVIAFSATIFSLVSSASYVRKLRSASFAVCGNLHSGRKCHTLTPAIFSRIFSVVRYGKVRTTMLTCFIHPNTDSCHATH